MSDEEERIRLAKVVEIEEEIEKQEHEKQRQLISNRWFKERDKYERDQREEEERNLKLAIEASIKTKDEEDEMKEAIESVDRLIWIETKREEAIKKMSAKSPIQDDFYDDEAVVFEYEDQVDEKAIEIYEGFEEGVGIYDQLQDRVGNYEDGIDTYDQLEEEVGEEKSLNSDQ